MGRSERSGEGRDERQAEAEKGEVSDTGDDGDTVVSCDISCKNGRQKWQAHGAQFPRSDVSG